MSEPIAVRVPQMNPNDEHAVVVRWHVAKGARVRAGQPLVTLETTKTTFDVDAPSDGFAFFEHEPNAELAVGAPVAWIADTEGPPQISAPGRQDRDASERIRGTLHPQGAQAHEGAWTDGGRLPRRSTQSTPTLVERAAAARSKKPSRRRSEPDGVEPLELSPSKITEIQMLTRVHEQTVPSTVTVAVAGDRLDGATATRGRRAWTRQRARTRDLRVGAAAAGVARAQRLLRGRASVAHQPSRSALP